jgi:hypothetical protein
MNIKSLIIMVIMSLSLSANAAVYDNHVRTKSGKTYSEKIYTDEDIAVSNSVWKVEGYPLVHSARNKAFGDAILYFNDKSGLVIEFLDSSNSPYDLKVLRFAKRNIKGSDKYVFQSSESVFFVMDIIDKPESEYKFTVYVKQYGKTVKLKEMKISKYEEN